MSNCAWYTRNILLVDNQIEHGITVFNILIDIENIPCFYEVPVTYTREYFYSNLNSILKKLNLKTLDNLKCFTNINSNSPRLSTIKEALSNRQVSFSIETISTLDDGEIREAEKDFEYRLNNDGFDYAGKNTRERENLKSRLQKWEKIKNTHKIAIFTLLKHARSSMISSVSCSHSYYNRQEQRDNYFSISLEEANEYFTDNPVVNTPSLSELMEDNLF